MDSLQHQLSKSKKMSKTIYGLSRSRDKHGNIVKRNLNDVVNCIHTNAGSGYKTMEILIVEVEDEQESDRRTDNGNART